MVEEELRTPRRKYAELFHGIRRHDIVSATTTVGHRIRYREFDYLAFDYTGRSLFFVIRLVERIDDKRAVATIEHVSERGEGLSDLCTQYNQNRTMTAMPHSLVYASCLAKSEAGVHTLAGLVRIADTAFYRLFPGGPMVQWYKLVGGPYKDVECDARELGQINDLVLGMGRYRVRGDVALWYTTG